MASLEVRVKVLRGIEGALVEGCLLVKGSGGNACCAEEERGGEDDVEADHRGCLRLEVRNEKKLG